MLDGEAFVDPWACDGFLHDDACSPTFSGYSRLNAPMFLALMTPVATLCIIFDLRIR